MYTYMVQKPVPHPSPNEEMKIHDYLLECFQPAPLWVKLSSSKMGISVTAYQPNLVARQFGLTQLLPNSLIPKVEAILVSIDEP